MKKKGFTLIELIVVMAILSILVLLGIPKYKSYTEEARITKLTVEAKELEKASQQYYIRNNDWPRLSDVAYTANDVTSFGEKIYASTGKVIELEVDGNYYDIDYSKLRNYISKPSNPENYILQNPVGNIFYMAGITKDGLNRLSIKVEKEALITLNPDDKGSNVVLDGSKLIAIISNHSDSVTRATVGRSIGKWYWEVEGSVLEGAKSLQIGVANLEAVEPSEGGIVSYYQYTGRIYPGGYSYGPSYTSAIISVLLDLDNGTVEFWKDGVSLGVAYTDLQSLGTPIYPFVSTGSISVLSRTEAKVNFGATTFKYKIPNGYKPYDYTNADWIK